MFVNALQKQGITAESRPNCEQVTTRDAEYSFLNTLYVFSELSVENSFFSMHPLF
jgi:hypothetical protein